MYKMCCLKFYADKPKLHSFLIGLHISAIAPNRKLFKDSSPMDAKSPFLRTQVALASNQVLAGSFTSW